MKVFPIFLLLNVAAFADYPNVGGQLERDITALINLARQKNILKAPITKAIPRLGDVDPTLLSTLASLAPEFEPDFEKRRVGYTLSISGEDYLKTVRYSALITTDKHIICIRFRWYAERLSGEFQLIGYSVELR
ncbi:MAG TPA: hypothetical protein VFD27_20040 [Chthoniobacteraceae bacterium]|jgi:hypothetical protein|nr:hypothetical protein [Chthoniobacteraceae bacterium]